MTITFNELKKFIKQDNIDTVLVCVSDMQGRLNGKRVTGKAFLDYVYKETLQELSLTESNLSIRLNNDLNSVTVEVQPSFVNKEPIVFATEYVLERRELMIIEASNVNSAYLHKNLWTPLFLLINSAQN